ncbi:hypothetical protein QYE76_070018 [Lolium multiflorum]|uniref:Phorbol-ester/DAG-type domain-containing protein n=1 Tax=Lolium multiflorum TaxID=4521 RepID=A0AAD8SJ39_LOLMU|nr:hypothetical protein QYE76_070018 [Lolium multiflorum]
MFADDPRVCDLCGTSVRGMHYSCRLCGFDVHPVCSQRMPVTTVSPLRPAHLLVITVATPVKCTRCSTSCVWRYWCVSCKVNLHPRCLLGTDQTPLLIPKGM